MLATVTVGAALGSGVGLPLATDFLPERLSSVRWVAASVLLPFAFALMMIVPAIVLRWRSGIRLKQQLALSEHRRQVAAFAQQATLAQLQALQAQIEPHFLYNTLTSLEYLIRHDSRKAAQMLQHLHAYLRSALPNIRSGQSTVKTECELARAYLNIMRIRLGERLRFTVSMDPAVSAAELPPLMLGTLVENAITHGIEPAATGGHVWIEAAAKDGQLFVQVVDNGVGLSGVGSTGLGLSNLQARLRGLYGDAAKLSITQPADGGLCAEIRLPLRLATMAEGAPC
jgi:sensor histidine kinase YesM